MSERPIGCENCDKPAQIEFVDVDLSGATSYSLCDECPHLCCLHKDPLAQAVCQEEKKCSRCCTATNDVRRGGQLGCPDCYLTFAPLIKSKILWNVPFVEVQQVEEGPKPSPEVPNKAWRLYVLHQSLEDAVAHENYEEAAKIRDEIRALGDNNDA